MKFWTIKKKFLEVFFCMCVCLSSCTVPSIAFFVHVCTCMFQYFSLYVCTHISSCIWGLGDWNSVCTADIYSSSTDFKFSDHCIQSYTLFIIIGYRIFKQNHATKCMRYLLIRYCEWIKQNTWYSNVIQ